MMHLEGLLVIVPAAFSACDPHILPIGRGKIACNV